MLRIVSAVALLAVAATGCGSGDRAPSAAIPGVPRALAQTWAGQAAAIASAASAGNSCLALRLATFLRDNVVSSEQQVPPRLRSPLLTDVNALAARITCTPVATGPPPPKKPKPPKEPKPKPKPPHHGPGGDKGDHH